MVDLSKVIESSIYIIAESISGCQNLRTEYARDQHMFRFLQLVHRDALLLQPVRHAEQVFCQHILSWKVCGRSQVPFYPMLYLTDWPVSHVLFLYQPN